MVSSNVGTVGRLFGGLKPQGLDGREFESEEVRKFRKKLEDAGLGVFAAPLVDQDLWKLMMGLRTAGLGTETIDRDLLSQLFLDPGIWGILAQSHNGTLQLQSPNGIAPDTGDGKRGRTWEQQNADIQLVKQVMQQLGYEKGEALIGDVAKDHNPLAVTSMQALEASTEAVTYIDVNPDGHLGQGDIVKIQSDTNQVTMSLGGDGSISGGDDVVLSAGTVTATQSAQASGLGGDLGVAVLANADQGSGDHPSVTAEATAGEDPPPADQNPTASQGNPPAGEDTTKPVENKPSSENKPTPSGEQKPPPNKKEVAA